MMARPVKPDAVLSKKAREKKREEEKAEKALCSGKSTTVEGDGSNKPSNHWHVELQWFRLLRGQNRLDQIARILVELSPMKIFDPRDIFAQLGKDEKNSEGPKPVNNITKPGNNSGSKEKKSQTLSKKDQFIQANLIKMQTEAVKRDSEKLRAIGKNSNISSIKLETEQGKLLLLLNLLKQAINSSDVVVAMDTMWEIQEMNRKVHDSKSVMKPFLDVIKRAREIFNDRSQLSGLNLVDFQLTKMSDRLPPLNTHSLTGKFRLDDWQLKVIDLVNKKKSVLVTAPTSSGKTVLSTYVCTSGARVLFVVPSEPLAWQVAAMLRALKLDISIVVPTLSFVPTKFDVVVGTPHSLESCLTKKIGFKFDYAVFDEVHSLNNNDGPAMQRLIRAIPRSCKILALSATVGNADALLEWWNTVVDDGLMELVRHSSRFINLQRYVWISAEEVVPLVKSGVLHEVCDDLGDAPGAFQLLHPVSSLTIDYLCSDAYVHSDIAFTPIDAFNLYKAMEALMIDSKVNIAGIKPKTYFSDKGGRITLAQAKEYEDAVKEKLIELAKLEPELCELLIGSLSPGTNIEELKNARKAAVADPNVDIKTFDKESARKLTETMSTVLKGTAESTSIDSLTDLFFKLCSSDRLPAICFQLDSVRCQCMFDGLLRTLEKREATTHPDYRVNLEREAKGLNKINQKAEKRSAKTKITDEAVAEAQDFGDTLNETVDVDFPHPDFIFIPPGRGMGSTEASDIHKKLAGDLQLTGGELHPLIRGLRRGVGIYIDGLPSSYLRLVQSFAQQGRLGVVLSDELLAYGVNMPFRSCVFFGDPGEDWLTPLVHQQMAGRAGRRGLDRQGHLIYAGFSPERLRTLLRGQLPDIVGKFPLYPTVPLQKYLNDEANMKPGLCMSDDSMRAICSQPLEQFLKKERVDDYYTNAKNWMEHLGILDHPESSYKKLIPELVWELRKFLPESLAIEYLLEHMVRKYKEIAYSGSTSKDDISSDTLQQTSVFLTFTQICSRKKYVKMTEDDASSSCEEGPIAWVKPLPSPALPNEEWEQWSDLIKQSQDRILNCDLPYKEYMLLPCLNEELDNMCYLAFVRNQIDPRFPTPFQHELRQRIWRLGEVMRICTNVLSREAKLRAVQNIIRKAFIRVRYILDEAAQRNWKKLDKASLQVNGSNEL